MRVSAFTADLVVHVVGLCLGVIGAALLLGIALAAGDAGIFWAVLAYAVGLLAMLGCSAAYNLATRSPYREWLRRCDHAAIFVMIAGTYTPFTTRMLEPGWAIGMTAAVWGVAALGAGMKIVFPRRLEAVSIAAYLGLGWVILVAWRPLLAVLDRGTLVLIVVGGLFYSVGTLFHLWNRLPFQNAIWHAFVLVAAICHYAAILGMVLAHRM